MEAGFELVVVAVDKFAELDDLPSTATGERLSAMLRPYGAQLRPPPKAKTANALRKHVEAWAKSEKGPASSILYWVGHGYFDRGTQWLLASGSKPLYTPANAVPDHELAAQLVLRWVSRVAGESEAWTIVVLDCCNPSLGSLNILHALTRDPSSTPQRLAVIPVASGASTVGRFVEELAAALEAQTENDDRILLRSLLEEVGRRLGEGLAPINWLPYEAALVNPRRAKAVLTMSVDRLDEWRALVHSLEPEMRSHFLEKAQSAELEDAAWLFTGRHDEAARLATWLREQPSGLLVVTGEPGAGKSALLGEIVTLADEQIVSVLASNELLADRPEGERPPTGIFDVVVHLTGKTLGDVLSRVAEVVPAPAEVGPVIEALRSADRRWTILVDALDEAQEPVAIAQELLRPLSELPNVRVVVGTRRSLLEGPDLPEPTTHELLDALGVTVEETVFLEREPAAMADYARRRLTGREGLGAVMVDDVAARMATVEQPFLFVRLATNELLARAGSGVDVDLDRLLAGGHRDLFAMAVERLGRSSPVVVTLLRALAHGQGRGVPRTDAVWATIARAVDPGPPVTEAQIDEALQLAAAYVTLDGEAGQSVYRLAHKTFAEHFHAQEDLRAIHARITAALRAGVLESGGWRVANPYLLLHLLEHAWADMPELDALCGDPGFLHETLRRFGADRLVENLVAVKDAYSLVAPAVSGAVRRARVALARHPEQLASQLQARLRDVTEPAVVGLVQRLPEIAPPVWLRSLTSHMTWKGDLEVTQDFPGKVRALAFGQVDGVTVLAVGVERSLHLWDPRAGGNYPRTVGNDDGRIIAAGLGTRRGRPVAVLASYESTVVLRDIRTGEALTVIPDYVLQTVCLGEVAGRQVIAGGNSETVWWWDVDSGVLLGTRSLGEGFRAKALASTSRGIVVGAVDWGGRVSLTVLDSTDMGDQWTYPPAAELSALAIAEVDGRLLLAAGDKDRLVSCWEWHGRTDVVASPVGSVTVDFPVRTVAVAAIDGCTVVAAGNDAWDSPGEIFGRVALRDPSLRQDGTEPMEWFVRPLAIARTERGLTAVCEGTPLRLRGVPDGEVVSDAPSASEIAEVLTAGGHPDLDFVDRVPDGLGLRSGVPVHAAAPRRRSDNKFLLSDPSSWPVTADTYGVFQGRPVRATGSYAGATWVWALDTGEVLAGPFARVPDWLSERIAMSKPGVPSVRSMSLCTAGEQTRLGTVQDGVARVWDVATQQPVDIDADGIWSAIALGEVGDRLILALGSDAGLLRLWDLRSGRPDPLADMTMDGRVQELWLVPGESTLAAMTYSYELLLFDFS